MFLGVIQLKHKEQQWLTFVWRSLELTASSTTRGRKGSGMKIKQRDKAIKLRATLATINQPDGSATFTIPTKVDVWFHILKRYSERQVLSRIPCNPIRSYQTSFSTPKQSQITFATQASQQDQYATTDFVQRTVLCLKKINTMPLS